VLEQPGRGLPHPEPTRQLDRADPALALGQVVEGQEPDRQRQLAVLEHRASGRPELLLAPVALEQLTGLERAEAMVAAGRAGEALAPAPLDQRRAACLLGPEPLAERGLAQAAHRAPQLFYRDHHTFPPARKAAESLAWNGMPVMDNQVTSERSKPRLRPDSDRMGKWLALPSITEQDAELAGRVHQRVAQVHRQRPGVGLVATGHVNA
jgi:hypothetical protein